MKYIWALIGIIALFGCQLEDADTSGCQEGEIKVNGTCAITEQNNARLFEAAKADVITEHVTGGFVAKPSQGGSYPGVVMIHEWWGLNDNIKDMAKVLAKEGYIVFAIDLYDGVVANDSATASRLAADVADNEERAIEKMWDAVDYLKDQENVTSVASLGWCFGGGQSLQLALNDKLNATVIYYGPLTDERDRLKNIKWPVLGIFGQNDTTIPVSDVIAFKMALDELNITNQIYIYPDVGHAFANPSNSNYAKEATLDAWQKTLDFLKSTLTERLINKTLSLDDMNNSAEVKLDE